MRRVRVQTTDWDDSRTVKSDAGKADLKTILRKYKAMGIVDHLNEVDLQYLDVSELPDFGDVYRQVAIAEQSFMKLPPKLREVFNNDVAYWLDCAHDKDKREALRPKLERLGLLEPQQALPDLPVAEEDPSTDS